MKETVTSIRTRELQKQVKKFKKAPIIDVCQRNCSIWRMDTMAQFLDNGVFSDVTLWCERKQIKCHRVTLASGSSYFQDLFVEELPGHHHFVIICQMKFEILKLLIEYIYRGVVIVSQHDISDFLIAGGELGVNGLCDEGEIPEINGRFDDLVRDEEVPENVDVQVEVQIPEENNTIVSKTLGKRQGTNTKPGKKTATSRKSAARAEPVASTSKSYSDVYMEQESSIIESSHVSTQSMETPENPTTGGGNEDTKVFYEVRRFQPINAISGASNSIEESLSCPQSAGVTVEKIDTASVKVKKEKEADNGLIETERVGAVERGEIVKTEIIATMPIFRMETEVRIASFASSTEQKDKVSKAPKRSEALAAEKSRVAKVKEAKKKRVSEIAPTESFEVANKSEKPEGADKVENSEVVDPADSVQVSFDAKVSEISKAENITEISEPVDETVLDINGNEDGKCDSEDMGPSPAKKTKLDLSQSTGKGENLLSETEIEVGGVMTEAVSQVCSIVDEQDSASKAEIESNVSEHNTLASQSCDDVPIETALVGVNIASGEKKKTPRKSAKKTGGVGPNSTAAPTGTGRKRVQKTPQRAKAVAEKTEEENQDTEVRMEAAIVTVLEGISLNKAAIQYGISSSTLKGRMTKQGLLPLGNRDSPKQLSKLAQGRRPGTLPDTKI